MRLGLVQWDQHGLPTAFPMQACAVEQRPGGNWGRRGSAGRPCFVLVADAIYCCVVYFSLCNTCLQARVVTMDHAHRAAGSGQSDTRQTRRATGAHSRACGLLWWWSVLYQAARLARARCSCDSAWEGTLTGRTV